MHGLGPCLRALQEGRLHRLAVPESLDNTVFVDPATNYVSADKNDVSDLSGKPAEQVELAVKLPELATAFGAHLEFVSGEQAKRVVEELGGLGGLRRW